MKEGPLEDEIPQSISGTSIWRLLVLFVFFLLCIDGGVYFYLKKNTSNIGYEVIAKKWNLLTDLKEKKDWLILGDSTCNQGISPTVWKETFHENTLNLCTIGDMLVVNDAWMLETYLKKFGPPKHVLIVHTYDIWARENVNLGLASQLPVLSLVREKPEPWVFTTKDEVSLLLYKYWPLFYQKQSLSAALFLLAKTGSPTNHGHFDRDGFMEEDKTNPQMLEKETLRQEETLKSAMFHMSTENREGLEALRKLSDQYNFNIFLANGPLYEGLAQNQDFQSYFSDIQKSLGNFARSTNKIQYLPDLSTFPKEDMASADHLITSAASLYTKKLSENVEKILTP